MPGGENCDGTGRHDNEGIKRPELAFVMNEDEYQYQHARNQCREGSSIPDFIGDFHCRKSLADKFTGVVAQDYTVNDAEDKPKDCADRSAVECAHDEERQPCKRAVNRPEDNAVPNALVKKKLRATSGVTGLLSPQP